MHHRDPNHCILLSPNFSFKATFVSARLVTKANLERTVPDLKEVLVSSEEGVARVRGAVGDSKGEVCYLSQQQPVASLAPAPVGKMYGEAIL